MPQPHTNASRTRRNEPPAVLILSGQSKCVLAAETRSYSESRKAKRLAHIPQTKVGLFKRIYAGTASPRQSIKAMCLECLGFDMDGIRDCTAPECPLYRFRPYQK